MLNSRPPLTLAKAAEKHGGPSFIYKTNDPAVCEDQLYRRCFIINAKLTPLYEILN